MKRLFFAMILIAGTLVASKSDAQCFRARVGFGFPAPRVYCAPRVIYSAPIPAPYYGGGVVVGPEFGYGYRHYAPAFYHERRWRGRRW